ncbi:activator-dependent family glycosyltransferase [Streptomyces coeruleorubidus]|jgi:glycosyltransferase|uniref:activator-dependent family glycosyltransferase n=1 Tax=Streptomyces coeruleorubidus TaxID=116188 RepID=UPI00237F49D5|nr:activator-dependent family glycosyltransferase [Streptomyces coeruleorubidus]WDV54511.1 activator-dependent family glycosyltransferase [Streptomyces coeruleorubidus]
MKVLVTAFAMDAHFNGVVPLAWALRAAGHDVRVASQPALTDSITRAGLTAVPVGTDHQVQAAMGAMAPGVFALHRNPDYLENRPELLDLEFLEASTSMLTAAFYAQINNDSMIDEMVDFAAWWRPDLVVWEPFTFAGAVAAQVTGAAQARLLWGPDLFLRVHDRFQQVLHEVPAERRDDALEEWLTWTLERHGAAFGPEVISGHWTIDQMPPSVRFATARPTVPMRFVPYNGPVPAVVPPWLRADPGRPRVLLTQGITERSTGFTGLPRAGELLASIAELDAEVVATVKAEEREGLPPLPGNVRVVDSLSLHVVLPSCAAVVHHGGAGTWATAALHGVPQLALAWQWDDVFRAGQLEKLGAGIFLPPHGEGASAGRVRDRLAQVLAEPSFRQGAARIRAEMLRTPAPGAVVPTLEQLTARHRAPAGQGVRH